MMMMMMMMMIAMIILNPAGMRESFLFFFLRIDGRHETTQHDTNPAYERVRVSA